jgi:hypothetical protein
MNEEFNEAMDATEAVVEKVTTGGGKKVIITIVAVAAGATRLRD